MKTTFKIHRGIRQCLNGKTIVLLVLVALLGGCDAQTFEPERDPDDVPASEILVISRVGGTIALPADGKSTDIIIVKIPKDAASRVITFKTTAGVFEPTLAQEIKVRAEKENDTQDDWLVARAVLRADTTATTATVSAAVSEFTVYIQVAFVGDF